MWNVRSFGTCATTFMVGMLAAIVLNAGDFKNLKEKHATEMSEEFSRGYRDGYEAGCEVQKEVDKLPAFRERPDPVTLQQLQTLLNDLQNRVDKLEEKDRPRGDENGRPKP